MSLRLWFIFSAMLGVIACSSSVSSAPDPPTEVVDSVQTIPDTAGLALHHVSYPPRNADSLFKPLLILLHGYGSNEQDLGSLAGHLDPRFHILTVRAPNAMQRPRAFSWYDLEWKYGQVVGYDSVGVVAARNTLSAFIPKAVERYSANPGMVYLMGFSQGGIMSLEVALSNTNLVKGIAVMSGRLNEHLVENHASDAFLKELSVLVVHGQDDQIIPVEEARTTRAFLESTPVELTYKEYSMGHSISEGAMRDAAAWLTRQLDSIRTGSK